MKVLFLSQGKEISTHPGFHDAFNKLKAEGGISFFQNIPFYGYAEKYGWDAFFNHVVELCLKENFDIVYFHFFHGTTIPSPVKCIEKIRMANPEVVILTSSGDAFANSSIFSFNSFDYPLSLIEVSRCADITFSTQMGKAADLMMEWGARNIVLSPLSMCQYRFKASNVNFKKHKFDFDVVFVGSKNSGRNFFRKYFYYAKIRERLIKALNKQFGQRFGLFGRNWDKVLPNQGACNFDEQQKHFRLGRLLVESQSFSTADYYTSNRVFIGIASGIPVVVPKALRLDKIFRDNEHVYFADDIDGVIDTCERLLKTDPEELYKKAARAAEYITERHTQYHRIKFKLDTAKRYLDNNRKLDVRFPFFLDEVDLKKEKKYAVRSR